ncbi:MAG: protein kinase [Bdellovibrionales bacterium]|nr:protein kinase [Bdellovibrionales bacterium]
MEREICGQAFDYEWLDLLGEGGSSKVFKALRRDKNKYFQDLVVIKILKSRNSDQRTRQELGSLRAVQCVHVSPLLAWDFYQQHPILVFEYTDSVSLRELLQAHSLLPREIGEIARQVQIGLQSLSSVGLCHGDLSPGNILIDTVGRVRLIDYGLGNVVGRMGTYPFVAPEVLNGQWANATSDLYSLGVLVTHLLGETRWFSGLKRLAQQWCQEEPTNRSWQSITTCPRSQDSLGGKVRFLLRKGDRGTASLSHYPSPIGRKRQMSFRKTVAVWIAMVGYLMGQIPLLEAREQGYGEIFFQPSKWVEVTINGRNFGYSPLRTGALPQGALEIKWRSIDSGGRRVLTLNSNQTIVLGDEFFLSGGRRELAGRIDLRSSTGTH